MSVVSSIVLILMIFAAYKLIRFSIPLLRIVFKLLFLVYLFIKKTVLWIARRPKKTKTDYSRAAGEKTYYQQRKQEQKKQEYKRPERPCYTMSRDEALRTLGLSSTATEIEIKHAFRKLAMAHHPDRFIFEEEKIKHTKVFLDVKNAYEYLVG